MEFFSSNSDSPLFLIVDGTSLAYRTFFAFIRNPLRNSKGENTSAPFAFVNSILKLVKDWKPQYLAVVFDAKGKTKRHKLFEEYKATRPPMPNELSLSLERIREITEAMGIKIYEVPGYEADDALATLVKKAKEKLWRVLINTSDKDLLQVVEPDVCVLDTRPKGDVLYTTDKVQEIYGFPPHRISDYLALVGDKIDNIPGVPGIGEKTAIKLIKEFYSIEELLKNSERIKQKKVQSLIEKFRDLLSLSKKLTHLVDDLPIDFNPDELRKGKADNQKLISLLQELELFSLLEKFAMEYPEIEIISLKDIESIKGFTFSMNGDKFFIKSGNKIYQASPDEVRRLFERTEEMRTADAKEAYRKFLEIGWDVKGRIYDPLVPFYLLYPEKENPDKEKLSLEILGRRFSDDLLKKSVEELMFVDEVLPGLMEKLIDQHLYSLYNEIELPLTRVLAKMEKRGIGVSRDVLHQIDGELQKKMDGVKGEIFDKVGVRFNLNSPKQLQEILFKRLKIPPVKRTKTGFSTDANVLQELSKKYEVPRLVLNYRELFKLKSSYIDALLNAINLETNRIHAVFHQTVTATGRISCSEPNLQTIPVRTELGRSLRKAFCAPPEYLLIGADYSQIELRILAHITDDFELKSAFEKDRDIHTQTATILFKKRPSEITQEDRRQAKVVNFGIFYGMSAFGLAKELGINPRQAQSFINAFYERYPRVKEWIDEMIIFAKQNGYVQTLFGRIRNIPEIHHPVREVRSQAERVAINTPIQGSAADIIKKAMVDIDEVLDDRANIVLQIHDELIIEVKQEWTDKIVEVVREKMENAYSLKVPLKVNIGTGKTWYEAKD